VGATRHGCGGGSGGGAGGSYSPVAASLSPGSIAVVLTGTKMCGHCRSRHSDWLGSQWAEDTYPVPAPALVPLLALCLNLPAVLIPPLRDGLRRTQWRAWQRMKYV